MWLEYLFATKVFSLEKRPLLTHKRATIKPLKNEIEIYAQYQGLNVFFFVTKLLTQHDLSSDKMKSI